MNTKHYKQGSTSRVVMFSPTKSDIEQRNSNGILSFNPPIIRERRHCYPKFGQEI